jgi:hypothetical protein
LQVQHEEALESATLAESPAAAEAGNTAYLARGFPAMARDNIIEERPRCIPTG